MLGDYCPPHSQPRRLRARVVGRCRRPGELSGVRLAVDPPVHPRPSGLSPVEKARVTEVVEFSPGPLCCHVVRLREVGGREYRTRNCLQELQYLLFGHRIDVLALVVASAPSPTALTPVPPLLRPSSPRSPPVFVVHVVSVALVWFVPHIRRKGLVGKNHFGVANWR